MTTTTTTETKTLIDMMTTEQADKLQHTRTKKYAECRVIDFGGYATRDAHNCEHPDNARPENWWLVVEGTPMGPRTLLVIERHEYCKGARFTAVETYQKPRVERRYTAEELQDRCGEELWGPPKNATEEWLRTMAGRLTDLAEKATEFADAFSGDESQMAGRSDFILSTANNFAQEIANLGYVLRVPGDVMRQATELKRREMIAEANKVRRLPALED